MDYPLLSVAFIFSDKGHRTSEKAYIKLADSLKEVGIEPLLIDIPWKKYRSFSDCILGTTQKVYDYIQDLKPLEYYFVGHQQAAILALHVGYLYRAKGLLLSSMAPYFQEELPLLPLPWRIGAQRNYGSSKNPSYPNSQITIPTILVQGEKEKGYLNPKIIEARQKLLVNSELIIVPKTGGVMKRKNYQETLTEAVQKLKAVRK